MRIFTIFFIVCCCYASSLFAHKGDSRATIQTEHKKLYNFSKKEKSSLKIDLFLNRFDFLHHHNQDHSNFNLYFLKLNHEPVLELANGQSENAVRSMAIYSPILQYHYLKHSFW